MSAGLATVPTSGRVTSDARLFECSHTAGTPGPYIAIDPTRPLSLRPIKKSGQAAGENSTSLTGPIGHDKGGFAVIPVAAIDPPHSAASPAVPALIGSGSPLSLFRGRSGCRDALDFGDRLKLGKVIRLVLGKPADNARIAKQFADISLGDC